LEIGLIAVWGIYGACLGNLIGEAILCIWALKMLHEMGIESASHWQLLRAVPAAIAMALAILPFTQFAATYVHPIEQLFILGVGAAVSSILFVLVCLLCGAFRKAEFIRVWQAFRGPERSSSVIPVIVASESAEAALN
jgi:stage V sporulation protein B